MSARNLTRAVQVTFGAPERAGAQKIGVADLDDAQREMLAEALRLADADDGWAVWVFAAEPNGRGIYIARLRPNQRELALPGCHVIFGAGCLTRDHDGGAHVHLVTHNRFGENPAFAEAVLLAGEWIDGMAGGDTRIEQPS